MTARQVKNVLQDVGIAYKRLVVNNSCFIHWFCFRSELVPSNEYLRNSVEQAGVCMKQSSTHTPHLVLQQHKCYIRHSNQCAAGFVVQPVSRIPLIAGLLLTPKQNSSFISTKLQPAWGMGVVSKCLDCVCYSSISSVDCADIVGQLLHSRPAQWDFHSTSLFKP